MHLNGRIYTIAGFLAGFLLVYGMVLSIILIFSGLWNIDSLGGLSLQLTCLLSLWFFSWQARRTGFRKYTHLLLLGFSIGTFLGFTFVGIGVWHGVVPQHNFLTGAESLSCKVL